MGQEDAPEEAHEILKEPDVTVTNQSDKEVNLDKLLKLKGLMKTDAGRRAAEGRHVFMEAFLTQLRAEWNGER